MERNATQLSDVGADGSLVMRRATIFVHLHKADVPVKAVEIPPAPTAAIAGKEKDLQMHG